MSERETPLPAQGRQAPPPGGSTWNAVISLYSSGFPSSVHRWVGSLPV
jgi:hypothetical protein